MGYDILGKASVQVTKQRKEDGSASLSLCHCYDPKSGGHVLRVSCSLWVFNCTGLPIALRQSWLAEGFGKQVYATGLEGLGEGGGWVGGWKVSICPVGTWHFAAYNCLKRMNGMRG